MTRSRGARMCRTVHFLKKLVPLLRERESVCVCVCVCERERERERGRERERV